MTGINSALGPITAVCPGDRRADRGPSYRPVSPHRQRNREETERKKLSDKVSGVLIKKDQRRAKPSKSDRKKRNIKQTRGREKTGD